MLAQPQRFLFPEIIKPWEHKKNGFFSQEEEEPMPSMEPFRRKGVHPGLRNILQTEMTNLSWTPGPKAFGDKG